MNEPPSTEQLAPGDVRLECELVGPVSVVRVGGDLDLNTAPSLTAYLDQRTPGPVVIDLCNVVFLGSAGLAALVQSQERASATGQRWALVATGSVVLRPLEATGLLTILNPYPSVDEAISAFPASVDD
jgi:anti-anti-sigma factor